jgi:hypothetical protein
MSWGKREVNNNFVALGDGEGDVLNNHFDKPKMDYEFINKAGETVLLSGSASLARQISADDMGKFFKAEFEGWGKSANGKFKQISVYIWDGEPNDAMQAWPRFAEFYGKKPAAPTTTEQKASAKSRMPAGLSDEEFETIPKTLDAEDDDLPF